MSSCINCADLSSTNVIFRRYRLVVVPTLRVSFKQVSAELAIFHLNQQSVTFLVYGQLSHETILRFVQFVGYV